MLIRKGGGEVDKVKGVYDDGRKYMTMEYMTMEGNLTVSGEQITQYTDDVVLN